MEAIESPERAQTVWSGCILGPGLSQPLVDIRLDDRGNHIGLSQETSQSRPNELCKSCT
jgi:hypothetical protein